MITTAILILLAAATAGNVALAATDAGQAGPQGVWLGQDGHDYCQTASALGPNDIQDLHVRIEGLPADEEIESVLIRRDGGGEWDFNGQQRHWKAQLFREPKASIADLYLEPSHDEQTCRLDIEVRYLGGKSARFSLKGGRSNPNLFMAGVTLAASWVGQDGHDWTGSGPAVGPDGFEDARVDVTGLSTKLEIKSLAVDLTDGSGWEYGLNPNGHSNAELVRDAKDRSRGSLFFSPDRDLKGQELTFHLIYINERSNSTTLLAGSTDPRRKMPKPPEIHLSPSRLSIQWLGQDGKNVTGSGDVHALLEGLTSGQAVLAAALSDKVGGYWLYRRDPKASFYPPAGSDNPPSLPLALRRQEGATTADLFFQPYRDETNTPMVLRVLLDDGANSVHRFVGETCDPSRRGSLPAGSSVEVKPGDDLNALVEKFGTVRLARGRYVLEKPLRLGSPITITGDAEAVLTFTQRPDEPAWGGAILIGASHVTLQGFSIRFADAFRWAVGQSGGAALIRTYDRPGSTDPKADIVLARLDIESSSVPPPADPKQLPEAPCLTRLAGATSGKIVGNRFRGGTVDVANGPWHIADNEHRGTVPGTVAWDAFGGHWLHDFTLERNRVLATPPSGKTWRFISMNQLGQRIVIRDNNVSGVGMRDDDTVPNPNAPEILLTESYRLYYEGKPSAISSDGWVLQIPMVMDGAVRASSIVSILTGEHAGRYFTIAQPLTPIAFLMADPLPPGDYAVSVAHGYVDCLIERNRIDVRGGKSAVVVLAGNHWGLRLMNNHLLGGGDSLLVQSTPTEQPFIWGWSHTPFLGLICQGNLHEDSLHGVSIDVFCNRYNKTTSGRTYLSGLCQSNTIRWTRPTAAPAKQPPDAIRIGTHSGDDPGQMKLTVDANNLVNPSGEPAQASLVIRRATINREAVHERKLPLPAAPPSQSP